MQSYHFHCSLILTIMHTVLHSICIFWMSGVDENQANTVEDGTRFVKDLVMCKSTCLFYRNYPGVVEDIISSSSTIMCDKCKIFLHCPWIGISSDHFTNGSAKFYCCQDLHPRDDIKCVILILYAAIIFNGHNYHFRVIECYTGKRKSVLHVSDVKTLYPNQGVCLMQLLISFSGNDHFFDCGRLTYTTLTCR